MAKKPSSAGKKSKRGVDQSAARGGGLMSLNKSKTSPFMKSVIILIIVAMVTLFLYGGVAGIMDLFRPQPKAPTVDPVVAVQNKYDPQIERLTTALASDPTSYTLLVALGNRHYDYAVDLMKLVSDNSTAALLPSVEQWTASKDVLKKAVAANKKAESGVRVDYAVATYYSGDTTAAIKIATAVSKTDPTFAPAFYNLGFFYEGSGNNTFAIAAYQKFLALDPTGKTGNLDYVKQQLKALGAPEQAPVGTPITTGSAPTTP